MSFYDPFSCREESRAPVVAAHRVCQSKTHHVAMECEACGGIPSRVIDPTLPRVTSDDQTDNTWHRRIWSWGRTTAWKIIKSVMREAEIAECLCKPKALRHAFAVEAGQKSVPLNIVQRWLGHARIETTAIYAGAIGDEERNLARKAWSSLELAIPDR